MAAVKPYLHFVGSSGCGKSTLMKWAAAEYGLPVFPSVNTAVYRELGTTPDAAIDAPHLLVTSQRLIHERVLAGLREAYAAAAGLAADRGPDLLVYTCELLGGWQFYKDWALEPLLDYFRRPEVLVFFVRPDPYCLADARVDDATEGGRRARFLSDQVVARVDGMTEHLLDDKNVPYVTLDSGRAKIRTNTVRRVVELWAGRYKE